MCPGELRVMVQSVLGCLIPLCWCIVCLGVTHWLGWLTQSDWGRSSIITVWFSFWPCSGQFCCGQKSCVTWCVMICTAFVSYMGTAVIHPPWFSRFLFRLFSCMSMPPELKVAIFYPMVLFHLLHYCHSWRSSGWCCTCDHMERKTRETAHIVQQKVCIW